VSRSFLPDRCSSTVPRRLPRADAARVSRVAILATLLLIFSPAAGQGQEASSEAPQIGLIDMAYVFKHYEKFKGLTESLQDEIERSDAQAQALIQQIKQSEVKLASGELQEGSPDFLNIESEILDRQTQLQALRKRAQREFLKKEADIYKTVYLEVEDAVQRYARYYNYALVLRFNRERVEEAENPRDIINGMNRQVIFYRHRDDLTEPILNYLNDQWRQQQAARGSGASPP
jgi:Skp family chaperone for outer membrane proteins